MKKKAERPKAYIIPHLDGFIIIDGELKAITEKVRYNEKVYINHRELGAEEKRRYGIIRLPRS